MKNLLSVFVFALLCILGTSCEKDIMPPNPESAAGEVVLYNTDPGGCTSGTFTRENNWLRFTDEREYEKTLNFLSCASANELELFRSTLPVETAQMAFMEFRELTKAGKVNSAQELLDFEADFDGRITVHVDEITSDRSYSPSIEFFEDIAAPDGIYMVGDDYFKVVEKKLYRLQNGTAQQARDIDRDTEPTPEGGVGHEGPTITVTDVVITTRGDDDPNCCPYSDKFENEYNGGQNKLQIEYKLLDIDSHLTGSTLALKVNLWLKASHDKKVNLGLFSYWACDGTSLGMGYTVEMEYQPTGTIFSASQSWGPVGSGCTFTQTPILASDIIENTPAWDWDFRDDICLNEVRVDAVNGANGVTVSGDCGEATNQNELNPKIVFYRHNNLIGPPICTIPLDPSVGHIDFTEDDVCQNDEARSAALYEIPAGSVLRVFDNSNGSTNDDFAVITALTDIIYFEIDSFEDDFSSSMLTINYCCGGNLDGKVSSFRDF